MKVSYLKNLSFDKAYFVLGLAQNHWLNNCLFTSFIYLHYLKTIACIYALSVLQTLCPLFIIILGDIMQELVSILLISSN